MKDFFKKNYVLITVIILFILFSVFLAKFFSLDKNTINNFLKDFPFGLAAVLFILLYVVSNFFVFWDLKDLLKPIGAVFFGAYISTLLIYIAEIINAYIFFTLSRRLGMEFAEKYIKGKFKKFYENVGDMKLGWIALLRLIILLPYRILDLSFGLSKVPFRRYMLAVVLASIPRIFWIQFIMASIGGFSAEKMMAYFQENILFTLFVFLYFVGSMICAFKLGKKLLR
jgi:uncharacterized membrane protein YdjX (TVP38/TMEM64 family)